MKQHPYQEPAVEVDAGFGQALLAVILSKIAVNLYKEVTRRLKLLAMKHLPNQWLMEWIARHDSDPKLRALAVRKIVRPKVLKSILLKEKHPMVRDVALDRLPPRMQASEYISAKTRKAKIKVLAHIVSQETLGFLLSRERDPQMAQKIMGRLADTDLIVKMKNHSLKEVRDWVARSLNAKAKREQVIEKNPKVLMDAILGIKTWDEHIEKLLTWVKDPEMWYNLVLQHPDPKVKEMGLRNIADHQALLALLVQNKDQPPALRWDALTLIADAKILRHLAESKDAAVRANAVARLSPIIDADYLDSLLIGENDLNVLSAAAMVSKNKTLLLQLVDRIKADPKKKDLVGMVQDRIRTL